MDQKLSEQMSLRLPFKTMELLKSMSREVGRSAFIRDLIERAARQEARVGRARKKRK